MLLNIDIIKHRLSKKNKVINSKTISMESRALKKEKEKELIVKSYKEKAKDFSMNDIEIRHGSFQDVGIKEKCCVDLIMTDPPYPREYLYLWKDLFVHAKRVLKETGFLVAYSGQSYLDTIFELARESGLTYFWMCCLPLQGYGNSMVYPRKVSCYWKPVLVFQNVIDGKPVATNKTVKDVIDNVYDTGRELHDKNWGQGLHAVRKLIHLFSNTGDLVYEPFAGTGTTLLACYKEKRRCVGIEKEFKYIDLIKGRLADLQSTNKIKKRSLFKGD